MNKTGEGGKIAHPNLKSHTHWLRTAMPRPNRRYGLPPKLAKALDDYVEQNTWNYTCRQDVVAAAVRDFIAKW